MRFEYEHVERAIVYRVLSIVYRLQTVHRVLITASYIVHRLPCCYRGSVRLELNYVWLFLRSFLLCFDPMYDYIMIVIYDVNHSRVMLLVLLGRKII